MRWMIIPLLITGHSVYGQVPTYNPPELAAFANKCSAYIYLLGSLESEVKDEQGKEQIKQMIRLQKPFGAIMAASLESIGRPITNGATQDCKLKAADQLLMSYRSLTDNKMAQLGSFFTSCINLIQKASKISNVKNLVDLEVPVTGQMTSQEISAQGQTWQAILTKLSLTLKKAKVTSIWELSRNANSEIGLEAENRCPFINTQKHKDRIKNLIQS